MLCKSPPFWAGSRLLPILFVQLLNRRQVSAEGRQPSKRTRFYKSVFFFRPWLAGTSRGVGVWRLAYCSALWATSRRDPLPERGKPRSVEGLIKRPLINREAEMDKPCPLQSKEFLSRSPLRGTSRSDAARAWKRE